MASSLSRRRCVGKMTTSTSACLTLHFLNGDILLRNGQKIQKCPGEMYITHYIQYIAFNKFTPPGETKHLSFSKECRISHVLLNRSGRLTERYLWDHAGVSVWPSQWPHRRHQSRKCHTRGLNDFQRDCLPQLTEALREEGFDLYAQRLDDTSKLTWPTQGPRQQNNTWT